MSQWRKPPPVVILSGNHDFLRRRELKEAIRVAEVMGRSLEYAQGTDRDELSRIVSSTGVFFQEEVLVIIENPEKIDADLVINHHESGDTSTVFVLHQPGAIPPKSTLGKIAKALPDRFVAKFEKPKPWDMVDHAATFCVAEARKHKVKLSDPLARAIVQNAGQDLGVLSFEVQKLAFFLQAQDETDITIEHVKVTIASFSELGPKPVIEALEKKDLSATSRALVNMRRTHAGNLGGAALLACAWVGKSAASWLHIAALNDEGYSLGEISARSGIHEFIVRKTLLPVARRWGQGRLTSLIKSIARVERSVRSGQLHPWVQLECALFRSLEGSNPR